jgi:2-amino-4-hydroxy-6-hydroxymethyldihydropteridine diphosphokinase
MIAAYIGLGSNLQEPIRQLRSAVASIRKLPDSNVAGISSAYGSAALGPGEQPDYLNAVLCLHTDLAPQVLLGKLQQIESSQGRVRTERWGARTLDLDILLYGNLKIATPDLTIPHASLSLRNFVLYPLAEISGPNLVLPDGSDLGTLLARCPRRDLVETRLLLEQDAIVPGDGD